MIGCLPTHVRKQPIIARYFEFATVLKFYNLEALTISILLSSFSSLIIFVYKLWNECKLNFKSCLVLCFMSVHQLLYECKLNLKSFCKFVFFMFVYQFLNERILV